MIYVLTILMTIMTPYGYNVNMHYKQVYLSYQSCKQAMDKIQEIEGVTDIHFKACTKYNEGDDV